jgi:uncharacterized membrane protein
VVQGVLAGLVAVVLAALWRRETSFDLKAALAVGTVMVVPVVRLARLQARCARSRSRAS